MKGKFPRNIDIDALYYLFSLVRWHRDMGHAFCKSPSTADGNECLYAVDRGGELHTIGHVRVLDGVARFTSWIERLEAADPTQQ